jgi:hypothetical protein
MNVPHTNVNNFASTGLAVDIIWHPYICQQFVTSGPLFRMFFWLLQFRHWYIQGEATWVLFWSTFTSTYVGNTTWYNMRGVYKTWRGVLDTTVCDKVFQSYATFCRAYGVWCLTSLLTIFHASWWSVLLATEIRIPIENHRPYASYCNVVSRSPCHERQSNSQPLVVKGNDTIASTMVPFTLKFLLHF